MEGATDEDKDVQNAFEALQAQLAKKKSDLLKSKLKPHAPDFDGPCGAEVPAAVAPLVPPAPPERKFVPKKADGYTREEAQAFCPPGLRIS